MSADRRADAHTPTGIESGFAPSAKGPKTLEFSHPAPAQNGASESARSPEPESRPNATLGLGEALGVSEVACLLGCSAWTVRHKYLPQGLPHVRASAMGKIVFFKTQVIAWIVRRQQLTKGGNNR